MNIPLLWFGTWKLTGDTCIASVSKALEVGYRHIDTADRYDNHQDIAKAIKDSGIAREELFITTKIWFDELYRQQVLDSTNRFLEELQIPYIDLLLIHWPNRQIPIEETFGAFTEIREKGLIKNFGVSNHTIHHLEDILTKGYEVTCNQVELHPTFNQKSLHDFCKSHNITLTAYSPLGMGEELQHPTVIELSQKYSVSPAQVILNWINARGIVAIPKSSKPENIEDNFKSQNWKMEPDDIVKMNNIEQKPRLLTTDWQDFDY